MKRGYITPETERYLLEPDDVICASLTEGYEYGGEDYSEIIS